MILASGIALFCVMYVSLFVPIDKSGPRILCILIPMNLSLMFSRRMRRRGPDHEADVNQPCDIFFFMIFWFGAMHFIEYLVAFTSIARITNEINRDQDALEDFVYTHDEASDASEAASVGSNSSILDENRVPVQVVATDPTSKKASREIIVPAAIPPPPFSTKKEIRVPKPANPGAPTTIKVPSLESATARQKFRTRSIRYSDGTEHTETEILPLSSSDSESENDAKKASSQETLPMTLDEDMDSNRKLGLGESWATIEVGPDGKKKKRRRKKTSDEEIHPIISYVPADVSARHYYLWTFAFILYIFSVVYIL